MVTKQNTVGTRSPGATLAGSAGPGGGGRGPERIPEAFPEAEYEASFAKSRILTMFLLLVVLMTFGGVISAYIVISTNGVLEWRPFDLPLQVWMSTAIIVASSVTYIRAERAIRDQIQQNAKIWLIVTTILGAAFVSSQILVWFSLVKRGVYVQSNPYAGFFYILTALHAVHVAGGIIALGYVVLMAWERPRFVAAIDRVKEIAGAVGWYWHFMGILWIVLLVLLGFWK
jgi:cytochrome c oxidase subunit 3